MQPGEHIYLLGSRRKAAEWLPFARKQARLMRERGWRVAQHANFKPRVDTLVKIVLGERETFIWISVAERWGFAAFGWEGGIAHARLSKDLSAFPRRVDLFEAEVPAPEAGRNVLPGPQVSYHPLVDADAMRLDLRFLDMYGRRLGGLSHPEGRRSATQAYGGMWARPRTYRTFPMQPGEFGFHTWARDTQTSEDPEYAPVFLRTLDNGETYQDVSMGLIPGYEGWPHKWYVDALRRDLLLGLKVSGYSGASSGPPGFELCRSVDKGSSWASFPFGGLWDGIPASNIAEGSNTDGERVAAEVFIGTARFYLMQDRILLVGFVLTEYSSSGGSWGYYRLFVSTDDGMSFSPRGFMAALPQDANGRTLLGEPGLARPPVVTPDNRIVSLQPGGNVRIADQEAMSFESAPAAFPVMDANSTGIPTPILYRGEFKISVVAAIDDLQTGEKRFVVYLNTDSAFSGWFVAGEIARMPELPHPANPYLVPYSSVYRFLDPPNPAFPDAFEEDE